MKFQNPQCLIPLVNLLMCDQDFGLRWRSLEALRKLTGQNLVIMLQVMPMKEGARKRNGESG